MSRPVLGWTRIAAAALAVAVMAGGLLWLAEPAQAHDQLIGSSPADGETLQVPPEEVVLRFSGTLLELGGVILVTDAGERSWTEGDLIYDGSQARTALKEGMPDGWYEIRWQVVSRDGHPISGIIPFSIGDAGDRPSETAPAAASDGQNGTDRSGDMGPIRIGLAGLAGAAIAVGGYWLIRRLLRRHDTHHGTDEPDSP